ncbi:hypothetical protein MN116_000600, partial [Schistosoma mekongi]
DSVRINSPHCLVKMLQDPGTSNYILLISQYEKSITIYYTLRVYSTAPFTLSKIIDPYTVSKQKRSNLEEDIKGSREDIQHEIEYYKENEKQLKDLKKKINLKCKKKINKYVKCISKQNEAQISSILMTELFNVVNDKQNEYEVVVPNSTRIKTCFTSQLSIYEQGKARYNSENCQKFKTYNQTDIITLDNLIISKYSSIKRFNEVLFTHEFLVAISEEINKKCTNVPGNSN